LWELSPEFAVQGIVAAGIRRPCSQIPEPLSSILHGVFGVRTQLSNWDGVSEWRRLMEFPMGHNGDLCAAHTPGHERTDEGKKKSCDREAEAD
jgi:hypothetical protein